MDEADAVVEACRRIGNALLHRVEHVKYRRQEHGQSPIGTLSVYQDRTVWRAENFEPFIVAIHEITGQRLSAPEHRKVQLQIMMTNDRQATFVFLNPEKDRAGQTDERDKLLVALRGTIERFRRTFLQLQQQVDAKQVLQETRKKLLMDPHLYSLYVELVTNKYITAEDFWEMHLDGESRKQEAGSGQVLRSEERMGVSAGFLTSIVGPVNMKGGLKLNITPETQHAIFRTYPAVERKFIELVPHQMTQETFWTRFYESHYFHRERTETDPKDPFFECLHLDEEDMNRIKTQSAALVRRQRDLSNLDDDLGLIAEMRDNHLPIKSNAAKLTLLKRCNYHSERILDTIRSSTRQPPTQLTGGAELGASDQPTTSSAGGEQPAFDFELESHELEELSNQGGSTLVKPLELKLASAAAHEGAVVERKSSSGGRHYSAKEEKRFLKLAEECAGKEVLTEEVFNHFSDMVSEINSAPVDSDEPMHEVEGPLANGGSPSANNGRSFFPSTHQKRNYSTSDHFRKLGSTIAIEEVQRAHLCLHELLRHFWTCYPATTTELRQKAARIHDSLLRFEREVISECAAKHGELYVEHCFLMLEKAKTHYENLKG